MASVPLSRLVDACDHLLKTDQFRDWDGALNGLQVQNSGRVSRIAAAVDARATTIRMAADAGADLLIVHHGLFWSPQQPWTGPRYDLLRQLFQANLAVYSSHLPLDAHPKLGNSSQLARALGLRTLTPFFEAKGQTIGFRSRTRLHRTELTERLAQATGSRPVLLAGGPELCRSIGVVTGGAGAEIRDAARCGIDTFITGEGPHWTASLADDLGINVLYAGHYATETFGVKALAHYLSGRFRVPWQFLDCPTGL
ncbi:MAG: Nif3-like dinuclear metal center hexameric protein [Verrucomicrobiales bacterium]|nr:Nif3-like dinuclear metal center hexameric protein [Verrucomicrobiales bacterium]